MIRTFRLLLAAAVLYLPAIGFGLVSQAHAETAPAALHRHHAVRTHAAHVTRHRAQHVRVARRRHVATHPAG